jgi:tRNA(Ile)-lysidine synthase
MKNVKSPVSRSRKRWQAAAERLAIQIPISQLHPAVVAWAETAPPRTRWGIGFSGGADSLALLLLVWAHWPKRRRWLRALHFDHRLRGAESRADARFCRTVCAGLNVSLLEGKWPGKHSDASEAEARAVRMAFFSEHARIVWLGHQQDDIAETMLMRLARGSGTAGLSAPRPIHRVARGRVHVRPLLTRKKAELLAALRTAGIRWREDSSNVLGGFFRNRIRRDVLPAWAEAAQRDALSGAARSRMLLEEDDLALEAWLDELEPVTAAGHLALGPLMGKPRALIRRALHRWLLAEPRAGRISSQAFEVLLNAVITAKPTRHSLGRTGFAVINDDRLRFQRNGRHSGNFKRGIN